MLTVIWNEALKINGADPDFHRRDMWNAIQAGDFPGATVPRLQRGGAMQPAFARTAADSGLQHRKAA
jgi:catalase